jgi:hypothetical protein
MDQSSVNLEDREAALTAFEQARNGFEAAYRPIPDDALRFVPPGEDYTLGGLIVHVTDTIEHYGRVLGEMERAGFEQVRVVDPEDEAKRRRDAQVRDGFAGAERSGVFAELRAAHDVVADMVQRLPAEHYLRQAPVLYGPETNDPYATRAADVMGWLIDHYQEHIAQATDLYANWKAIQS